MPNRSAGRESDVTVTSFCPVAWLTIEPGHPSLDGHFHEAPVVPAVLLLEHLVALAQALPAMGMLSGIPVAKFMKPILPGREVLLGLDPTATESCRFVCRLAGETAAQGLLRFERPAGR